MVHDTEFKGPPNETPTLIELHLCVKTTSTCCASSKCFLALNWQFAELTTECRHCVANAVSEKRSRKYLEPSVRTYKRRFDRELKHIKLILTRERLRLPVDEWLDLVENTRQSILDRPQDYVCGELPPASTLTTVIEQVFAGFLEDQRLRAVQTGRPFRIPGQRHG